MNFVKPITYGTLTLIVVVGILSRLIWLSKHDEFEFEEGKKTLPLTFEFTQFNKLTWHLPQLPFILMLPLLIYLLFKWGASIAF